MNFLDGYDNMKLSVIDKLKKEGKKIGYTCSSFDLLHSGHVAMLSEAKAHCDYLVVGILVDPTKDRPDLKQKPIQSVFERWVQLQAIEYVDCIIPFETEQDIIDQLLLLKPHIRFCGEEYEGTEHTGHDIPDIEIYYNKRSHSFSTTELRERIEKRISRG